MFLHMYRITSCKMRCTINFQHYADSVAENTESRTLPFGHCSFACFSLRFERKNLHSIQYKKLCTCFRFVAHSAKKEVSFFFLEEC